MKTNIKFIIRIIIFVVLGYFITFFVFHICQGPERQFEMGDNYVMLSIPGPIYLKTSPDWNEWKLIVPGEIKAFLIKEPWFIGIGEKGWFVINKKTNEFTYPMESENEVRNITKLNFKKSDLIEGYPTSGWFPSRHEMIAPHTKKAVLIFLIIYFFIFIFFGIGLKRLNKIYRLLFMKGKLTTK